MQLTCLKVSCILFVPANQLTLSAIVCTYMEHYKIPSKTRIGHIHLKVSDLDKALRFYVGLLGFEIKQRTGGQVAFIAAGDYHHHIGLIPGTAKMRLRQPGKGLVCFTQL